MDVLLQDAVAAGQGLPQDLLRAQQEAAVRVVPAGPLQQVLPQRNTNHREKTSDMTTTTTKTLSEFGFIFVT